MGTRDAKLHREAPPPSVQVGTPPREAPADRSLPAKHQREAAAKL
jgi:hypothetical protein